MCRSHGIDGRVLASLDEVARAGLSHVEPHLNKRFELDALKQSHVRPVEAESRSYVKGPKLPLSGGRPPSAAATLTRL